MSYSNSGNGSQHAQTGQFADDPALVSGGPESQRHPLGATLPDLLEAAAAAGEGRGVISVGADGRESFTSYASLLAAARWALAGLQRVGLRPGDKALLQLGEPAAFLTGLWACFLGGVVAAPAAIAPTFRQDHQTFQKLVEMWKALRCPVVLCQAPLAPEIRAAAARSGLEGMRVVTLESLSEGDAGPEITSLAAGDLALLLPTSGSTGIPKLVGLNHRNLLSMSAGTIAMNRFTEADVTLNWMPLEHVGALVFLGIVPLDLGAGQIHAPTNYILQDPARWLDLIERHRASISWAPNFAFPLVHDRVQALPARRWDLSSMRFLVNAGEPIVIRTVRPFLESLGRHGLPADALRPAFGMSETCSGITWSRGLSVANLADDVFPDLGPPIPGASIRVVDDAGELTPVGTPGRIQLRGPSVTGGYYRNPEANASAFTPDGWFDTGDLGVLRAGCLVITGRKRDDIIINGAKFNSHEIEALIEELEGVEKSFTVACAVRTSESSTEQLAVFFCAAGQSPEALAALGGRIRGHVARSLSIAVNHLVALERHEVPKTEIGKIQRQRLRDAFQTGAFTGRTLLSPIAAVPAREPAAVTRRISRAAGAEELGGRIAGIWQATLKLPAVRWDDNFFELGGQSLLLVQAQQSMQEALGVEVSLVEMFQYPTINQLSQWLASRGDAGLSSDDAASRPARAARAEEREVAVIGLACRFPGAGDPREFWRNLCDGVESIDTFSVEDLLASGVPESLARDPKYVRAKPILRGIENFDAEFFGYGANEADLLDPQHRLFLECAWECLEDAGYNTLECPERIGLFAGAAMNTYLLNHVLPARARLDPKDDLSLATLDSMGGFLMMVANDKDYLPSRTSYKMNLRGPSVNVQTACSTTLVTIHTAVQSLLSGECEMALAGGVSVHAPQRVGHLFQEGMIVSSDGHCRAFDARADGTIFGSGAGVALLKPLSRAVADGDHIYAVIKGSAVNNDGARKVGYMAPGIESQTEVVSQAIAAAGIDPATVGYVEAHGTGTPMGDPIEITALSQAYGRGVSQRQFCAVGSVKTNVGHLQIASGIAGFIKAVLAVYHGKIPPTLHFENPNPAIRFAASPFFVNPTLIDWPARETPRRAGVHSLGIGGTNAHVILEAAPPVAEQDFDDGRPGMCLVVSGRTEEARRGLAARYRDFIADLPDARLSDFCYTINRGRVGFDHRLAVLGAGRAELRERLDRWLADGASVGAIAGKVHSAPRVAFLFPGQGSAYAPLERRLYETAPVFRGVLDQCDELLRGRGLPAASEVLLGDARRISGAGRAVEVQPALFSLEYALAVLLRDWGIEPAAVMGHSLGEYVAACVAGVFSLEEGIQLVGSRARLMDELAANGGMAAVFAGESVVAEAIAGRSARLAVAAVNGPAVTVISGGHADLATVLEKLRARGIRSQKLTVSHPFHSPLMEPMISAFAAAAQRVAFARPSIPMVSNVTGAFAGAEVASAEYWSAHTLQTVRFAPGVRALAEKGIDLFLELGPTPALRGMIAASLPEGREPRLPHVAAEKGWDSLWECLGQLAVAGVKIDWAAVERGRLRRRMSAPTYPFQRRRYWLEPRPTAPVASSAPSDPALHPLLARRFHSPLQPGVFYDTRVEPDRLDFVADHRIYGQAVMSGACYLAMALEAAARELGTERLRLERIVFAAPLIFSAGRAAAIQLGMLPAAVGNYAFKVIELGAGGGDWTLHAEGEVGGELGSDGQSRSGSSLAEAWRRCSRKLGDEEFYQLQARRGIELGPSYRWLQQIALGEGEAVCAIERPAIVPETRWLHPGLLDACFGLLAAAVDLEIPETFVPVGIERFRLLRRPSGRRFTAHARLRPRDPMAPGAQGADIRLFDENGELLIECVGLVGKTAGRSTFVAEGTLAEIDSLWEITWAPEKLVASPGKPRNWLIFADAQFGAEVGRRLEEAGHRSRLVITSEAGFLRAPDGGYQINPSEAGNGDRLWRALEQDGFAPDAVIYGWGMEAGWDAARAANDPGGELQGLLFLARALQAEAPETLREFWLVTVGAQASSGAGPNVNPAQAMEWGVIHSFALETPLIRCACVDLERGHVAAQLDDLARELSSGARGQRVALRQDGRRVARLAPLRLGNASAAMTVKTDRSYLITGGTGALGLLAAEWLVAHGAKHLVLVSRRGADDGTQRRLDALTAVGAMISTVALDISEWGGLNERLLPALANRPPLAGVIHAAGISDDAPLAELDWRRFQNVLRPKVAGAWNLHRFTEDLPLDFFILYSSAASFLGNMGQANYAAANAFLDALAHYRRGLKLPATSISWGPWRESGMAVARAAVQAAMTEQGFHFLSSASAFSSLEKVVARDVGHAAILTCDWRRYADRHPLIADGGFLPVAGAAARTGAGSSRGWGAELASLPEESRKARLTELLRETVARLVGGKEAGELEIDEPLMSLGLDSLMAVRLRNRLSEALDRPLPAGLSFNYPTIRALAEHLSGRLAPATEVAQVAGNEAASEAAALDDLSTDELAALLDREAEALDRTWSGS